MNMNNMKYENKYEHGSEIQETVSVFDWQILIIIVITLLDWVNTEQIGESEPGSSNTDLATQEYKTWYDKGQLLFLVTTKLVVTL